MLRAGSRCASMHGAAPLARARAACAGRSAPERLRPAYRKLSTAAGEAAAPSESGLAWLMREGQVDSGFWQGAALLGGVCLAVQVATDAQRVAAIDALLVGYRTCGLSEAVTDRKVIEDYVRKNAAAAVNVIYASPTFYFLFAKMHGQSLAVSAVRAFTGTMRIVPFMGFFYGAFALICPFVTDALMRRGQTYGEAQNNAGMTVMLSGFVVIEAIVEMRGCGVTFGQMNPVAFLLFLPALVGRLATGVLTQQQKVGAESEKIYPDSWLTGPTWQQHAARTCDRLHLDKDFATTALGSPRSARLAKHATKAGLGAEDRLHARTSVFQHVLNGVTWTLLTKGKGAGLAEMLKFTLGGMGGTVLSGLTQFGKTLVLRSLFGFAWNWCSSQEINMPAFDAVLRHKS